MSLRVLLVEPWYAGSHRAWADGYATASAHRVRLITHPGEFWRWRLRGGAVTLAEAVRADVAAHGSPDVLLTSSMVDLAELLGFLRRYLPHAPAVLYMHENQVVYPHPEAGDVDAAYRTWVSMLAADLVLINSEHHLAALGEGLRRLLAEAPDLGHGHLLQPVLDRVAVVPVGVDIGAIEEARPAPPHDVPVVLWNHRWDPDKRADVVVDALERLAADGVDFEVVLAGQDDWRGERRDAAAARLGDRVRRAAHLPRADYVRELRCADVVAAAPDHEFFGVSVVEAIAAGCVPVLPRAHSYPELVPERWHRAVFGSDGEGDLADRLGRVLRDLPAARRSVEGLAAAMHRFDWSRVAPRLDAHLAQLAR